MSDSNSTPDDELTLSLPSLAFVAVLTIFAIRWFWSSRGSGSGANSFPNGGSRSSSALLRAGGGAANINPEHVEQISQMFPQLSRRDIMWDLRRNGGSVTATTERILQGRELERVSTFLFQGLQFESLLLRGCFGITHYSALVLETASGALLPLLHLLIRDFYEQPPPSFQPEIPPPSSTPYTASSPSTPAPKNSDLITRYNLQSRINEEEAAEAAAKSSSTGWSSNKSERAVNLQKRRDEMILAARRKMLAKEKAAGAGTEQKGAAEVS